MKTYKLFNDLNGNLCAVYLVEEKQSIPVNPANTDYQLYLKWLSEGNTPQPADEVTA